MEGNLRHWININHIANLVGEFGHIGQLGNQMAGRKKKDPRFLIRKPEVKKRNAYNTRAIEMRGVSGREPRVIKAFWKDYTMDEVLAMTDEELIQAIDKCLDQFEQRQLKYDKNWSWPLNKEMLAIAPYEKK